MLSLIKGAGREGTLFSDHILQVSSPERQSAFRLWRNTGQIHDQVLLKPRTVQLARRHQVPTRIAAVLAGAGVSNNDTFYTLIALAGAACWHVWPREAKRGHLVP